MEFTEECLTYLKSTIDKQLLRKAVHEMIEDRHTVLQASVQSEMSRRFHVLNARTMVEDTLDDMIQNLHLPEDILLDSYNAYEKSFTKQVKSLTHLVQLMQEIFAKILDNFANVDETILSKNPLIVQRAIHLEIQRFIEVAKKTPKPFDGLDQAIQGLEKVSGRPLDVSDLESLCFECNLKSALPLLAIAHLYRTDREALDQLFPKSFRECVKGLPCKSISEITESLQKDLLTKTKKARQEPLNLERSIIASRGNLYVQDPDSKHWQPIPEPLAQQVANVPGVDLMTNRAIVFVADPKQKIGALVQVRLFGPSKRIASFDLDCADHETFNWISSDRDTQGNILLSWGSHADDGSPQWTHHACLLEKNLIEGGTAKRQSAKENKLQFEEFGDPDEAFSGERFVRGARFDFRNHGNVLSVVQASETESWIVAQDTILLKVPQKATSVFGYPLAFVVAKDYKQIELYRVINGTLHCVETRSLEIPHTLTSITIV